MHVEIKKCIQLVYILYTEMQNCIHTVYILYTVFKVNIVYDFLSRLHNIIKSVADASIYNQIFVSFAQIYI